MPTPKKDQALSFASKMSQCLSARKPAIKTLMEFVSSYVPRVSIIKLLRQQENCLMFLQFKRTLGV